MGDSVTLVSAILGDSRYHSNLFWNEMYPLNNDGMIYIVAEISSKLISSNCSGKEHQSPIDYYNSFDTFPEISL